MIKAAEISMARPEAEHQALGNERFLSCLGPVLTEPADDMR